MNFQSYHFVIPDGTALRFEFNDKRIRFAMQNLESTPCRFWIGVNPPYDIDSWLRFPNSGGNDIIKFGDGVFGPIYIAEQGGGTGAVNIVSVVSEAPEVVGPGTP